jgi:hypothetical protein
MSGQPPPQQGAPVVRRGRGTFRQGLHSTGDAALSGSSQLSAEASQQRGAALAAAAAGRFAFAFEKPSKPIDITGAGELEEAETARVQLFRKERRRRQLVVVGNLKLMLSYGVCKLFGHSGPKPLRLQRKIIKMVHLAQPLVRPPPREQPPYPGGDDAQLESDVQELVIDQKEAGDTDTPPAAAAPPSPYVDTRSTAWATSAPPQLQRNQQDNEGDDDDDDDEPSEMDTVMQPLTTDPSIVNTEERTASFPVLTMKRFKGVAAYFEQHIKELWELEDIKRQRVQLTIDFGAAYVCGTNNQNRLASNTTFPELVEKWNDESLQVYFIPDCPPCVSRAVDASCREEGVMVDHSYSIVKLTFFSQQKQTRSVARAMWSGDLNAFELIDVESLGLTFEYTIFSVDKTALQPQQTLVDDDEAMKKMVAFPMQLSFRAFHRSKNVAEHGASATAKAVLARLTEAEHNIIRHGSASLYDALDLTAVCEADDLSNDFKIESIHIQHIDQKRLRNGLFVEGSNSLLIEGFGEAQKQLHLTLEEEGRSQRGPRLSFFKTRSNTVHWKMNHDQTVQQNLETMHVAMKWGEKVLSKANVFSAKESKAGASVAPEAL